MGRPPCRWDGEAFTNRGDVTFGTAPLANWDPGYLHLAAAVNVPTAAAIDTAIAGDASTRIKSTVKLNSKVKPVNLIHFCYEALDSREQRVARLWDRRPAPPSWPAS